MNESEVIWSVRSHLSGNIFPSFPSIEIYRHAYYAKADVSSVSPSSERLEEWWVVWVYNQKTELRYRWEYGDQKTRIN